MSPGKINRYGLEAANIYTFIIQVLLSLGCRGENNEEASVNKKLMELEAGCPTTTTLTNGRLMTHGRSFLPIGLKLSFQCSRGFIIGTNTEAEVECFEDSARLNKWRFSDYPQSVGCTRGCLAPEHCPYGMTCDPSLKQCKYKECPGSIQHGILTHFTNESWSESLPNALGHTARLSCKEGFVIDHPHSLTVLARNGYNVQDDRVVVQCQLDEYGQAKWLILYQRSAAAQGRLQSFDVYTDTCASMQKTIASCIRGCHYDTHCSHSEICYNGECIPKVCPSRSLPGRNTVIMMQRAAPVGCKTTIRCEIGYLFSGFGHNYPMSVTCQEPNNLAGDPRWVLTADGATEVFCLKPCSSNDQCKRRMSIHHSSNECRDNQCIPNCYGVPHGIVNSASGKYGWGYPPGTTAKLNCQLGYVSGEPNAHKANADKIADVECIYQQLDGSKWRHVTKSKHLKHLPATCKRGCSSHNECHQDQYCHVQERACKPITCTSSIGNVNGHFVHHNKTIPSMVKMGEILAFQCLPGNIIFQEGLRKPLKRSELVCSKWDGPNGSIRAGWELNDQGLQFEKGCKPGCVDSSDCSHCEYCDQEKFYCRQIKCSDSLGDPEADFTEEATYCNEDARIVCNQGYVFKENNQCFKDITITCTSTNSTSGIWKCMNSDGSLSYPKKCETGCINDADCLDPDYPECSNCQCKMAKCDTKESLNSQYLAVSESSDTVLKVCKKLYVINGTTNSETKLECKYFGNGQSHFVDQNGNPEPDCIRYCQIHSQCNEDIEVCISNQCVKVTCPLEIKNGAVFLRQLGAPKVFENSKAVISCLSGYVPKPNQGKSKVMAICKHGDRGQNQWVEPTTFQRIECKPGCLHNRDCLRHQKCEEQSCVPRKCQDNQGLIMSRNLVLSSTNEIHVGAEGTLFCDKGYFYKDEDSDSVAKSMEVVCQMRHPEPQWVIKSSKNTIHPCLKGCITDCDCAKGEYCEAQSRQCAPNYCQMDNFHRPTDIELLPHSDGHFPSLAINSTATLKCALKGFVFNTRRFPSSLVMAKCTERGACESGLKPRFTDLGTGKEVGHCSPGCGSDSDCSLGEKCGPTFMCEPMHADCRGVRNTDPNSFFAQSSEDSQSMKKVCRAGFKLHSGNGSTDIVCKHNQWLTLEGLLPPSCCKCPGTKNCTNHCPPSCHNQDNAVTHGHIQFKEGTATGALGVVICDGGHKINDRNGKLMKSAKIQCKPTKEGYQWMPVDGEIFPSCERLHSGICLEAADCGLIGNCTNSGNCVKRKCPGELEADFNGFLKSVEDGQQSFAVGTVATYNCKHGFHHPYNPFRLSLAVFCDSNKDSGQRWKTMHGFKLKPCAEGCYIDAHCSKHYICNRFTRRCEIRMCPKAVKNGSLKLKDKDKATILCNDGYLASPSMQPMINADCMNGQWLTDNGTCLHEVTCKPACNKWHGCQRGYFCTSTLETFGKCVQNMTCPNTPFGSNLILEPNRRGLLGSFAKAKCPRNLSMYSVLGEVTTEWLICTNHGWVLADGSNIKNPLYCTTNGKNENTPCKDNLDVDKYKGTLTSSTHGVDGYKCILGHLQNEFILAEMQADMETIHVPISCIYGTWHILRPDGTSGPSILPCITIIKCQTNKDCPGNKVCSKDGTCISANDSKKQNSTFLGYRSTMLPNGTLIDSPIASPGEKALVTCNDGMVMDTSKGPRRFLTVIAVFNKTNGHYEFHGTDAIPEGFCRPGCLQNFECKDGLKCNLKNALCKESQCSAIKQRPQMTINDFWTNPESDYQPAFAKFVCNKGLAFNHNQGKYMGQNNQIRVACVEDDDGNMFWETEKGERLQNAECVKQQEPSSCADPSICSMAQESCSLSSIPSDLVIKHISNDNGVLLGSTVKVTCQEDYLLMANSPNKIYPDCYGQAVDLVCNKLQGMKVPSWTVNGGSALPTCIPVCSSDRSCTSIEKCDTNKCGTCVKKNLKPCKMDDDCKENEECLGHPDNLANLVCLPICTNDVTKTTIFKDPITKTNIAHCDFHFKFNGTDGIDQMEVTCDRKEHIPKWKDKISGDTLPSCVFDESPCATDRLLTLTNGGVMVNPGKLTQGNKLLQQTAIFACNNHGFHLAINDAGSKDINNKCLGSVNLICKKDEDNQKSWILRENGDKLNLDLISCKPGCVNHEDCSEDNGYCNQDSCSCITPTCTKHIGNGKLTRGTTSSVGFTNSFHCDAGYVIDYPDEIFNWYMDCMNETKDCSTDQLRSDVPIECVLDTSVKSAYWIISYEKIFRNAWPKPKFPHHTKAACVAGCNSDLDCGYSDECGLVFDSCKSSSGCQKGACIPQRCTMPSRTLGGALENSDDRSIGVMTDFACRDGYVIAGTMSKNITLKCTKMHNKAPAWMPLGMESPDIPACIKECSIDEQCGSMEKCFIKEKKCIPSHCDVSDVKFGKIKANLQDKSKSTLVCSTGYITSHKGTKSEDIICKYFAFESKVHWVYDDKESKKAECIHGCISNQDCVKYGTQCDHTTATCVKKACPVIDLANSDRDYASISEFFIGDESMVKCKNGYVYNEMQRQLINIQCILDENGIPTWKDSPSLEDIQSCKKGCIDSNDCNENEVCESKQCTHTFCKNVEDAQIEISCPMTAVDETCQARTRPPWIIVFKDEKGQNKATRRQDATCSLVSGSNNGTLSRNTEWRFRGELREGCLVESQATDCQAWQECGQNFTCQDKTCPLKTTNEQVKNAKTLKNFVHGQGSGQEGILVCLKGSFVRGPTPSVIDDELDLKDKVRVKCMYQSSNITPDQLEPVWVESNYPNQPIQCLDECIDDENCTDPQQGICRNNRCKPSCCMVPKSNRQTIVPFGLHKNECVDPGSYSTITCKEGHVVKVYESRHKEVIISCEIGEQGAQYFIPVSKEVVTKYTCQKGCETDRDCSESETCSKYGQCVTVPCKLPIGVKNGQLRVSNLQNLNCQETSPGFAGIVGCKGVYQCGSNYVYSNPSKDKSKAVSVECVIDNQYKNIRTKLGQWMGVDSSVPGKYYNLNSCHKGCLESKDCWTAEPMCRECSSGFMCQESTCNTISVPNVIFSNQDHLHSEGSVVNATCVNGFIFKTASNQPSKSVLATCCPEFKSRSCGHLKWNMDVECSQSFPLTCVKGCIPDTTSLLSADCETDEICLNNRCQAQECQFPDDPLIKSSSIGGKNQSFPIGSKIIISCSEGYTFYPKTRNERDNLKIACMHDPAIGLSTFRVSTSRNKLPYCQRPCQTKSDCQPHFTTCLNGVCVRDCKRTDSIWHGKVAYISNSHHVGSNIQVICDDGYLIEGQENKNISMQCTGIIGGTEFCTDDGICDIPQCSRGCIKESDCSSSETCIGSSLDCPHSKCCKALTCKPSSDHSEFLQGVISSKSTEIGSFGNLNCNPDTVYFDPKAENGEEPKTKIKVRCIREVDSSGGGEQANWVVVSSKGEESKLDRCTKGCNIATSFGLQDCKVCNIRVWKIFEKKCPLSLNKAKLKTQQNSIGTSNTLECTQQPGFYIEPKQVPPATKLQVHCDCKNNKPKWITDNGIEVVGCTDNQCTKDNDCLIEGYFCNTKTFTCEEKQCYIFEDMAMRITKTNGRVMAVCKENHMHFLANGTKLNEVEVQCGLSKRDNTKTWLPIEDSDDTEEDEELCKRSCSRDKNCGSHQFCSENPMHGHSTCKFKLCIKPYNGANGKHVRFVDPVQVGGHSEFQCNIGYAMRFDTLKHRPGSGGIRRKVSISCQRLYSYERGTEVAWTLDNGNQIPDCSLHACETTQDCGGGKVCSALGSCETKTCLAAGSPHENARIVVSYQSNKKPIIDIGSKAKLECIQGFVMRSEVDGQCYRNHQVICTQFQELSFPDWQLEGSEERNSKGRKCFPGCQDQYDCKSNEYCDSTICKCRPKLCRNTIIEGGFIQVHVDAHIGAHGVLVCSNQRSRPVCGKNYKYMTDVVCVDLNPKPQWRTQNGLCAPKCVQIPKSIPAFGDDIESCTKDSDCKMYHVCRASRCFPAKCHEPELKSHKGIVSHTPIQEEFQVGTIVKVGCDVGFTALDNSLGFTEYICHLDLSLWPKFKTLDGREEIHCIKGCLKDTDCQEDESCTSRRCVPIFCKPIRVANGQLNLPSRNSFESAVLRCDHGYIPDKVDSRQGKDIDVYCNSQGSWTYKNNGEGDKVEIPKCVEGCYGDYDCNVGEQCTDNACLPKSCKEQLGDHMNAKLRLRHEGVPKNADTATVVCLDGYVLKGLHNVSVAAICKANFAHGPMWTLVDGTPLPKCLQTCSKLSVKCLDDSAVCKRSGSMELCEPTSCIQSSLSRDNAVIRFQDESSNDVKVSVGSVGQMVCDQNFIIDSEEFTRSRVAPVICIKDTVCGGTKWTTLDGNEPPFCTPGCAALSDEMQTSEKCDVSSLHETSRLCDIPHVQGADVQLGDSLQEVGTFGKLTCDSGKIYKKASYPLIAVKQLQIFCTFTLEQEKPVFFDDYMNELLPACNTGCVVNNDCPTDMTCNLADYTCVKHQSCKISSLTLSNWEIDSTKDGEIEHKVGKRIGAHCKSMKVNGMQVAHSIEAVCTGHGWVLPNGKGIQTCRKSVTQCSRHEDCPTSKTCLNSKCVDCSNDEGCPPGDYCDEVSGTCSLKCTKDLDCDMGNVCDSKSGKCKKTCKRCIDCPLEAQNCISGLCIKCYSESDCDHGMHCQTETGLCLECLNNNHCYDNQQCLDFECTSERLVCQNCTNCPIEAPNCIGHSCVKCSRDSDCDFDKACQSETGLCVECLNNNHCYDNQQCLDFECTSE